MMTVCDDFCIAMPVCSFDSMYTNQFAGVEISIEQTTYTVLENGINREVCAVLSSGTEIPVSITLITMDGSAISTSQKINITSIISQTHEVNRLYITSLNSI